MQPDVTEETPSVRLADPARPTAGPAAVDAPAPPRARTTAGALIAEARPRQWLKNVLLLAAPAAAGVVTQPEVLGRVALGIVAFSLAASGTYYLNDVADAEADRRHPRKRHRPIAAGLISERAGAVIGAGLLLAAFGLSVGTAAVGVLPWTFAGVLGLYVVQTVAYSVRLKHVPIVDAVIVAAGFVLRGVGGGLAAGVPLSHWFLLVISFWALFVVIGKRHAEVVVLGEERGKHRRVLAEYTTELTQHLLTLTSAVTVIAYSMWAFQASALGGLGGSDGLRAATESGAVMNADIVGNVPWAALSVLPYVGALARWAMLVFAGRGGEPEELVMRDRPLQLCGLAMAVLLAAAVYL